MASSGATAAMLAAAAAQREREQAAAANQITGIIAEKSNQDFDKLVKENNLQPAFGFIKVPKAWGGRSTYRIGIVHYGGVTMVSFYPEDYQPGYKHLDVGTIFNPANIIMPKARYDELHSFGYIAKAMVLVLTIAILASCAIIGGMMLVTRIKF